MTQLTLIPRSFPEPRRRPVPTPCPFTVGKAVRNTRLHQVGKVLDQLHHTHGDDAWWTVRINLGDGRTTSWLASLCEVA